MGVDAIEAVELPEGSRAECCHGATCGGGGNERSAVGVGKGAFELTTSR